MMMRVIPEEGMGLHKKKVTSQSRRRRRVLVIELFMS